MPLRDALDPSPMSQRGDGEHVLISAALIRRDRCCAIEMLRFQIVLVTSISRDLCKDARKSLVKHYNLG
jgi:hypothetical protein